MSAPFVVHFFLFLFSLAASILQGVTGFGDAILLQVVWYTATVISPADFNTTALGDSPVRAVTLLMYCRIVFSAPVLAYMSLRDGVFSLQMTLAMAVPSTLTACIGVFIFKEATNEELKLVLGISGLVFAAMYVVTIATKYVLRQRKLRFLSGGGGAAVPATAVTILPETEAIAADLDASGTASFTHGSAPSTPQPDSAASPAFVSIATGSPFLRREAEPRTMTESGGGVGAPPLTPSKLSPSNTMLYTRVRVNRNLDENGRVKRTTKIGASVAALLSGIMGSLTGVGGPPHIIFVLLFDVPQYIMRVNFSMQSIPSAALRFIYACSTGLFTTAMIPLFVNSLIGNYIGIVLGVKLGKMLGPKSYSIFVLVLLLLSSLVMITKSVTLLVSLTVIAFLVTIAAAVYEHRQTAAKVKAQVELETELEERRRGDANNADDADGAKPNASQTTHLAATAVPAPTVPNTTPLSPQAMTDFSATPLSSAVSNGTKELSHSHNVSNSALEEIASVSTGVSSRTSSRIRRAELHRPPPLWDDVDRDRKGAAEAPTVAHAARGRSVVVNVPAVCGVTAVSTGATPRLKASNEKRGMGTEEVKLLVALEDEEIDASVTVASALAPKAETK